MNRENEAAGRTTRDDFAAFLRTGQRIEWKFNPYHDPRDGRFTTAEGAGGSAFAPQPRRRPPPQRTYASASDPKNPRNHTGYTVKAGDTLTKIASQRTGLRASDLAWLNGISSDAPLRIGQTLKIPNQSFLDAGRDAKNKFLALSYYIDTHAGHLPADPAHPPSLADQILGPSTWRRISENGYAYKVDPIERPRNITGIIAANPNQSRSKTAQANAGGTDRLSTDQGGHYIARRFNGPTDAFNHFAQDADFNRGAYRRIENIWAKADRAGKKVWVNITPSYKGFSKRPEIVNVKYRIGDNEIEVEFKNRPGGK